MSTARILVGDALDRLSEIPDKSVRCVVTSPPYYNLRNYEMPGQIGLERTPAKYVAALVRVFTEVKRVLTEDGTLWLNIGDSYSRAGSGTRNSVNWPRQSRNDHVPMRTNRVGELKNLLGIPWRLAFALQDDGWIVRSEIIWKKSQPMPESVVDRPTKSHEQVFLLTKQSRYYYDADAIKEDSVATTAHDQTGPARIGIPGQADHRGSRGSAKGSKFNTGKTAIHQLGRSSKSERDDLSFTRNKRDVWTIPTQAYPGPHFAVMPEALAEPCILAGSAVGDTVLDPFAGAGTTGLVALRHGRNFVGIELNPAYAEDAAVRIRYRGDLAMAARGDPKMFDDASMLAECEIVLPERDKYPALGA